MRNKTPWDAVELGDGTLDPAIVKKAIKDLGVNPEKPNPAIA